MLVDVGVFFAEALKEAEVDVACRVDRQRLGPPFPARRAAFDFAFRGQADLALVGPAAPNSWIRFWSPT